MADHTPPLNSPAKPHAPDAPVDDEAFIDWALDQALLRLEDGLSVTVDDLLCGRERLRAQVREMIHLAREIASGIAPSLPEVLPAIRGYTALRELGSGGMGRVYLARQERLGGRAVALKVLPTGFGLSPRARERFQNEANAIARLRHPHIVAVHDVLHEEGVHAYAMEWVDGASLQAIIDALTNAEGRDADASSAHVERSQPGHAGGGRMSIVASTLDAPRSSLASSTYEVFVTRLGVSIARALGEVHRAGFLHRDIKPSNLLLRRDGTPLLSDFGLVREADATISQAGHFAGTPAYASPEQLRGEIELLDARSDVFSLGATLYHALCLRRPFSGGDVPTILRRIEGGDLAPLRTLNNRVPRDLETVIAKAMDAEACRRYASTDDLADDLERLLNLQPIRAKPAGALSRSLKLMRRNRRALAGVVLGGAAAILLCVLAALWLLVFPRWAQQHVRDARIALLNPSQTTTLFSVGFWGLTDDEVGKMNYKTPLPEEHLVRALESYDAALSLRPWDASVRQEREVIASVIEGRELQVPASADAHTVDRLRGLAAFLRSDIAASLEAWSRYELARGPRSAPDPLVAAATGTLYIVLGEPARAYPRLQAACHEMPELAGVRFYLADAAIQCGDLELGQQILDDVLSQRRSDQGFGGHTRVRANLLAAQGRIAEAEALYRSIPDNPIARLAFGDMLISEGRYDDALGEIMVAAHAAPKGVQPRRALVRAMDLWWPTLDPEGRAKATITMKSSEGTHQVRDSHDLQRIYAESLTMLGLPPRTPGTAEKRVSNH